MITNAVDGWNEWSKYVLKELERLNDCYEKLDHEIDNLNERMTFMQAKIAGIAVAVGLGVTVVGNLLFKNFFR